MSLRVVSLCLFVLSSLAAQGASAFGLEDVEREARDRAARPYQARPTLDNLPKSYDEWRGLRFRPEKSLWRSDKLQFEAQFFPAGGFFTRPIDIFEIIGDDVHPVPVTRGDFFENDKPLSNDTRPAALAGFRIHYPLNNPAYMDEMVAFIGASYFRALGEGQQYGSSARALALDTTGGNPEEFPDFVRFWLVKPTADARSFTMYALLDSPRASGAYRFDFRPGVTTEVDVRSRVYLRAGVTTFGVAPLTGMFFGGENQPPPGDFRPEIHDTDGLQVNTGSGEWIWRPLVRPQAPFVTSFSMDRLGGFGLMQRDRRFASYEDLEAHYHRRPSIWVQPLGDWGPGRVELMQLPARNEADDNMVAFWVPAKAPQPGKPVALDWRLSWAGDNPPGPSAGRTVQTRVGFGYLEKAAPQNRVVFHVDFAGGSLAAVPADAKVEAVASGDANTRVVSTRVEPNTIAGGWRMTLDVERLDRRQPLELRAFLRLNNDTLTETWTYALASEP